MFSSKKLYTIIIAISILLIAILISIYLPLRLNSKKISETYECYILSIFWTPTTCETKNSKNSECYQKIRELGMEKYFTLHGLWPSPIDGSIPPACNEGVKEQVVPNFDDDPKLKIKLEHLMPGLWSNDTYFWSHEYNKHGYCYMKRNYLNFLDDYKIFFEKSVNFFEKSYKNLMEEILPDSKGVYNVSKAKFRNMLKFSSLNLSDYKQYCLMCDEKTNLLSEIYFIFDLNYNPIIQTFHQENCPDFFLLNFTDETKQTVWEKYDTYNFALQYSPNTCIWKGESCYEIINKKENYKFGIHGLWPNYKSGIIPQECNIGEDIEVKVENNPEFFENYFLKYCYSLYNSDNYFLTHEFNKHGFCYNKRMNFDENNYYYYFNKSAQIYIKYNFNEILDNILKTLSVGEHLIDKNKIKNELDNNIGKNSYALRCKYYNGKYYLDEIYFKLDLEFNITTEANFSDSCENIDSIWINVFEPNS